MGYFTMIRYQFELIHYLDFMNDYDLSKSHDTYIYNIIMNSSICHLNDFDLAMNHVFIVKVHS